jgi:hypothetical protein
VCSFHTPPATGGAWVNGEKVLWGRTKPETLKRIAEWLSTQDRPIIVGIDANTPETDHPNHEMNRWWWKDDEPSLLGPKPVHKLRDAFRAYLHNHPETFEQIQTERPAGPLAILHYRGSGRYRKACRYDFVLVSNEISVEKVEHRFDESLSDHALVLATLALTPAAHSAHDRYNTSRVLSDSPRQRLMA